MTRLMDKTPIVPEPRKPSPPEPPPIAFTDRRQWLIGTKEYEWAGAYHLLTRTYEMSHRTATFALATAAHMFQRNTGSNT